MKQSEGSHSKGEGIDSGEGVLKKVKVLRTFDNYKAGTEIEVPEAEGEALVTAGDGYYVED